MQLSYYRFILFLFLTIPATTQGRPEEKCIFYFPIRTTTVPMTYKLFENRIIGRYGDIRKSHLAGHRHAGIDVCGNYNEWMFAIGPGTVVAVFREFPDKTVYIRHVIEKSTVVYSVYIHLEDIAVAVGDYVTKDTPVGRLFNKQELVLSDFGVRPHLHLEIRHDLSDRGKATFTGMAIDELNRYCYDPLPFFYRHTLITAEGEMYEQY